MAAAELIDIILTVQNASAYIANMQKAKPHLAASEVKVRTVDGMQSAEDNIILLLSFYVNKIGST